MFTGFFYFENGSRKERKKKKELTETNICD